MNKKVKRILIEDINQNYQTQTTANDIITQSTHFSNRKVTRKFGIKMTLLYTLSALSVIFILLIGYQQIQINTLKNRGINPIDNNLNYTLGQEYQEYIMSKVSRYNSNPVYYKYLNENVDFFVYRGERQNAIYETEVVFFYYFNVKNDDIENLLITTNEEVINISKTNVFGILLVNKLDENCKEHSIEFRTNLNEVTYSHALEC